MEKALVKNITKLDEKNFNKKSLLHIKEDKALVEIMKKCKCLHDLSAWPFSSLKNYPELFYLSFFVFLSFFWFTLLKDKHQLPLLQYPFQLFSVTKICTGILALRSIRKSIRKAKTLVTLSSLVAKRRSHILNQSKNCYKGFVWWIITICQFLSNYSPRQLRS